MYHQERINKSSSMKVASTYGMNHSSTESALMDCSGGAFRLRKQPRSLKDATHHRMEDIMGHSTLMLRSSKVDYSSQPCMKTPKTLYGGASHVRNMGISMQETPCHSQPTTSYNSLISRESTTWGHFQNPDSVNIFWWQSTMSQNGLKLYHAEL
jgi:hypothetical protein